MKFELKVPEIKPIKQKQRVNQSHTGNDTQVVFYVKPAFATKLSQLAALNKRSISGMLAEMVEFCVDQLEEGEAELEQTPSDMHPLPVQPAAQSRSTKHLSGSDEVAAQTLRDRMGNVPDVSEAAEAMRKGNLRGMGYVVND